MNKFLTSLTIIYLDPFSFKPPRTAEVYIYLHDINYFLHKMESSFPLSSEIQANVLFIAF